MQRYRMHEGVERLASGFFFFQAEDGIRYLTVTGVQTCALPICARPPKVARGNADRIYAKGPACRDLEDGVIERVKHFGADLYAEPFADDRHLFGDRKSVV